MPLPDIVVEAVAVGESLHRGERDVKEAQTKKILKDLNQGASKSRASRFPGIDCIEGNAILDEDLLRQHFHDEKSSESLNKILNSLKYATSLEGQIARDKFFNGVTSKDLQRLMVDMELGYQASDEEMKTFMDGKSFVEEQAEMIDGVPLYEGKKPIMIMSLGGVHAAWKRELKPEGVDSSEDEGYTIMAERGSGKQEGEGHRENDGYQTINDATGELSTDLERQCSGAVPSSARFSREDQRIVLQPEFVKTMEEFDQLPVTGLQYQPLRSDLGEIRLLSFSRDAAFATQGQFLCVKLEHFFLDEAPKYTALSYAWGSSEPAFKINCNGETIAITTSLNNALGRVFTWNQRLYVWADGICINQQDITERSAQVQLMGNIYSRAARTAAYLGESHVTTEGKDEYSAFALMNMVLRIWHHDEEHALRSESDWSALQIPEGAGGLSEDVWMEMLKFWAQPWFSRAWVVQEVVLAKGVTVFYGPAVSTLETIMQFWHLARIHDMPPPLKYGSVADFVALVRNSNQLGTFKRLRDIREETDAAALQKKKGKESHHSSGDRGSSCYGVTLNCQTGSPPNDRTLSLLHLLSLTRANGASDSRDKVYSLLAMADDIKPHQMVPNYDASNTTARVYKSVAELYISRGLAIDVLHHAGLPQIVESLPTWVPDWSRKSNFPFTTSLYHSVPSAVPRIVLSETTSSLIIRGAVIDSFIVPGMICNFRSWDSPKYGCDDDPLTPKLPCIRDDEHMRRFIHMSAKLLMLKVLGPSYQYPTGEDINTVLWRTLVADSGWGGGKPTDMDRSSYEAFVQSYPSVMSSCEDPEQRLHDPELRKQSWPFETVMQDVQRGRRFGITACGQVGVFPGETRHGDLIVFLLGAKTPFVLRRSGNNEFKLVGDCYLHGVMDGELIHPDTEGERLVPLEDGYTETTIDGEPFSVRLRPWSSSSGPMTDEMKATLQKMCDPIEHRYAAFQDFRIC